MFKNATIARIVSIQWYVVKLSYNIIQNTIDNHEWPQPYIKILLRIFYEMVFERFLLGEHSY
jgi:hypothetical protein